MVWTSLAFLTWLPVGDIVGFLVGEVDTTFPWLPLDWFSGVLVIVCPCGPWASVGPFANVGTAINKNKKILLSIFSFRDITSN